MKNTRFITLIFIAFLLLNGCNKEKNLIIPEIEPEALDIPPTTWQEDWGEHNLLLQRVYFDDDVVLYYDDSVNHAGVDWMGSLMSRAWAYTKSVYGDFGSDPRLYVVLHAYKYGGGHPAGYMDPHHHFRNAIDCGNGERAWIKNEYGNYGMPIHEIAHIVEGAGKGVRESPSFDIWMDSKWAEIFIYDVFLGLGMNQEAKLLFDEMQTKKDDKPQPNTQWFKDWFYPIYSQHGGNVVLNAYFELLAEHFPKQPDAEYGGDIPIYSRRMNWGEFIHFWSGAAGTNLKELATNAFGWPPIWEIQFEQAKIDFPEIDYQGK